MRGNVNPKFSRSPSRRREILDASLAAFTELGYEATTISIVRQRSGATIGSIYHFFPSKAEIAHELLQEAIAGWSEESGQAALSPGDPKEAVQASVRGLLMWANKNQMLFRFMEEMRSREPDRFQSLFSTGRAAAESLYGEWIAKGLVKDFPWPVAYALMTGPAYLYLRSRESGKAPSQHEIDCLVEASWNAVSV